MSADAARTPRVLVADDDEINLMLLREAMESAGFVVVTAADGTQALREARGGRFDVVLLDVAMPGVDGYAVCRTLRASPQTSRLPVIMITSHDDSASIDRAYDAGATDFISKPINWHLMPHRLRYVLRSAESEARIRELAYFDTVTGLPNRSAAVRFIGEALAAGGDGLPARGLALLSLELPGIGRISENFGAQIADGTLQVIARRMPRKLQELMGERALVECARSGDAEFMVSLCGAQPRELALEAAAAIERGFQEPVAFQGHEFFLEPVMGIAVHPEHGEDAETLMMRAATARDHAASANRAGHEVYTEGMGASSRERLALDVELRRAVRNEELQLYFQPKLRAADAQLSGVEALLRWFHPVRGSVSPSVFVPLAEESGLILEIDAWVVRAACRQLRNWRDAGLWTNVAINLSGEHFIHGDPVTIVAQETAAVGIEPSDLTIEITESKLMRDLGRAQQRLRALRGLGCRIAIDDFGTGYSSLAYLRRLSADMLKIDRAFIQNVHADPADAAIVRAILDVARSLGQGVTAEGVETAQQLEWLRAHGCDEVQGYLTGAPAPAHEIARLWARPQARSGAASVARD
ncbi:MAG: EAL domain-containing protein [Steroidobacteraceae bacterium]